MSEIIECKKCKGTLVTNETNIFKDIPCPHCKGIASPAMIWMPADEYDSILKREKEEI